MDARLESKMPAKCHHILWHIRVAMWASEPEPTDDRDRAKRERAFNQFDKMFVDCWCDCEIPLWYISRDVCSSGMLNFNSFQWAHSKRMMILYCCCCCCCMQSIWSVTANVCVCARESMSGGLRVYVCDIRAFRVLLEPVSVSMVVRTNKIKSKHSFHTVKI